MTACIIFIRRSRHLLRLNQVTTRSQPAFLKAVQVLVVFLAVVYEDMLLDKTQAIYFQSKNNQIRLFADNFLQRQTLSRDRCHMLFSQKSVAHKRSRGIRLMHIGQPSKLRSCLVIDQTRTLLFFANKLCTRDLRSRLYAFFRLQLLPFHLL